MMDARLQQAPQRGCSGHRDFGASLALSQKTRLPQIRLLIILDQDLILMFSLKLPSNLFRWELGVYIDREQNY